jgi:hypothetical protein
MQTLLQSGAKREWGMWAWKVTHANPRARKMAQGIVHIPYYIWNMKYRYSPLAIPYSPLPCDMMPADA